MGESELFRAVIEAPDDDGARLVYADWLQQHGDPRGEYIALECALGQMGLRDPRRFELARRSSVLFDSHRDAWHVGLGPGVEIEFRRGLAWSAVTSIDNDPLSLLDRAPIVRMELHCDPHRGDSVEIARAMGLDPRLARLQELVFDLGGQRNDERAFAALIAGASLQGLRVLELANAGDAAHAVTAIAAAALPALATLRVAGDEDSDPGYAPAQALASAANLNGLRTLALEKVAIGHEAAVGIAGSRHLTRLSSLTLHPNQPDPASLILARGARALADSQNFAALEHLSLDHHAIGDDGLATLCESRAFPALRSLSVACNGITDIGVRAFAGAGGLASLQRLSLQSNRGITADGVRALATSPRLGSLVSLQLCGCEVGAAGAIALARSPHVARLSDIGMRGCRIGAAGARALAESPLLGNLERLQISDNRIDNPTRAALRARFGISVSCLD